MKIIILYNFKSGAWGGANQFAHVLRQFFLKKNVYTSNLDEADIGILFSYPFGFEEVYKKIFFEKRKRKFVVINRVYGPIFDYRPNDQMVDKINHYFNKFVSEGTIYQSLWSKNRFYAENIMKNKNSIVIHNASNPKIFNTKASKILENNKNNKISLIASSWSSNEKKGFSVYRYLDNNLDFKKYNFTFVGNSPTKFKNIRLISAVNSEGLAKLLKESDIFIFASELETCSNSLLEALQCGIPCVARNNSSQPEIVKEGGLLFNDEGDIIEKINKLALDINKYKNQINIEGISVIGQEYLQFCKEVFYQKSFKKWNPFRFIQLIISIKIWKFQNKLKGLV